MSLSRPLKSWIVTSPYGNRIHPVTGKNSFHNGVDIKAVVGTPIYAPDDAKVTRTFKNSIGGNQVILTHENGYTTGYAHLDKFNVSQNDTVNKGEIIGFVGRTGRVIGSHLHFTVKQHGKYVNPDSVVTNGAISEKSRKTIILISLIAIIIFIIFKLKK